MFVVFLSFTSMLFIIETLLAEKPWEWYYDDGLLSDNTHIRSDYLLLGTTSLQCSFMVLMTDKELYDIS